MRVVCLVSRLLHKLCMRSVSRFSRVFFISIPLFSPRNDKIFPAIYFASIRISYQAFGSRSDLRYVPTLRTFQRKNVVFIPVVRSRGPGGACRQKTIKFSPRFFPAIFHRDFSPRIIKEKMSIGLTVSWLRSRCRWCAQLRRSSRRSGRGA